MKSIDAKDIIIAIFIFSFEFKVINNLSDLFFMMNKLSIDNEKVQLGKNFDSKVEHLSKNFEKSSIKTEDLL